jgi:uncharacterized protein (TIGR00269 family)
MTLCTLCRRKDAVFGRSYSGEQLCGRCFCKSIEDKVRRAISKYKMLGPKDRIMVAVSGTVDEGIRDYRDEALKIAERNCRKLGIDHAVASFKEQYGYELDEIVELVQRRGERGLTPCSYCGVLRRKALNTMAREAGVNKLVTAHSLDDETQTMLLNLIHGDPLRIARSKPVSSLIHPKLVQRVKPLCQVPEKEVAFYAYLSKIEFQCIPCPYAQTALRNDIRSMLNSMEHKHAGTSYTIFNSMERIRPALEAFTEEVKLHNCKMCGEPTVDNLCRPCQLLQELGVL